MPWLRFVLGLLILVAPTGCAAAQPVAVADTAVTLGFRRVVTDGSVTIGGTLVAPAALLGGTAGGSDLPVPNATITAMDPSGQAIAAAARAHTDAHGHFSLSGLTLDQAAFLRASFTDLDGKVRSLTSFVRPESSASCVTISLASSLVAGLLQAQGANAGAYSQDKLQAAVSLANQALPALTASDASLAPAATASGTPLLGAALIDALTDPNSTASARMAAGQVAASVPGLQEAVSQALDSYLQVGFTIQDTGTNQFDYLSQAGDQTRMSGPVMLACQLPPGSFSAVNFWLGNQKIAGAILGSAGWTAAFDTRSVPDGAYVLAATARPTGNAGAGAPLTAKAFVVIDNTPPSGDNSCVAATP